MTITNDILLYLRLIMYPLTILAMIIIITIKTQNGASKIWFTMMIAGTVVVLSFFIIEVLLVFRPDLHEVIKSIILTPSITILTIGAWYYVFKYGKHNGINHHKRCNNGDVA